MTAELVTAARDNNFLQVQIELLKFYGNLTIYSYPKDNFSPLHWAVHHNNPNMLFALLTRCDLEAVLYRANNNLTAIEYATKLGYWDCLKVFLLKLANPKRINRDYFFTEFYEIKKIYGACLHLVDENSPYRKEMIRHLALAGASRDAKNADGLTSINSLIKKGLIEEISVFTLNIFRLDKYPDDKAEYGMALYTLIARGQRTLPSLKGNKIDEIIVKFLKIKTPTTWIRQSDGHSLLHLAIENDIPYWVELLIAHGADLNYRNYANQTPVEFFLAIRNKLHHANDIAKVLNVDLSFEDNNRYFPNRFVSYIPKFAPTETTESATVKKSVTQSILKLRQRYASQILQEIKQHLLTQPIRLLEKKQALQSFDIIAGRKDKLIGINMRVKEILILIWQAICILARDDNNIMLQYSRLFIKAISEAVIGNSVQFRGFTHVIKQIIIAEFGIQNFTEGMIKLQKTYIFYILDEIEQYILTLPETLETRAALQCLKEIKEGNSKLEEYYGGMQEKEVLVLIWKAICDTTTISDTKIVTNEYIELRKSALVSQLATAQIGSSGSRACFTGVIHQIVISLQGSHSDINIFYDDSIVRMDASANILAFVEQYLKNFPIEEICRIYNSWDSDSPHTAATRFRHYAVEPISEALKKVYNSPSDDGIKLSDNSIQQITSQFGDLPQPRLKNILLPPTESALEPLYKQLLEEVVYNNKLQVEVLVAYQYLINDIGVIISSCHDNNEPELTKAIQILCQRYIIQTDLFLIEKHKCLNEDYHFLMKLYGKLSHIIPKYHNGNTTNDLVKQAAIQNINVSVKSAFMLFASGSSTAPDTEKSIKENTIIICSNAIKQLGFFTKKADLEKIAHSVTRAIPTTSPWICTN